MTTKKISLMTTTTVILTRKISQMTVVILTGSSY